MKVMADSRTGIFFAVLCSCLCATATFAQTSGVPQVQQAVVAGGGGTSSNPNLRLDGTAGQSVTGTSSGGTYTLSSGFWPSTTPLASAISVSDVRGTFGGSVTLIAKLTAGGSNVDNRLITFPTTHQLPIPVVRLRELLRDMREIGRDVVVGQGDWQTQLENNKSAFALGFVSGQIFATAFPVTLNAEQFITQLDQNAGGVLSIAEKVQLEGVFGGPAGLATDASKRAQVLRAVAENATLQQREFNRAFVLMQYFGYLRRNPDDAKDTDYSGYDFWLRKLEQFQGDFVLAEMVKAFIPSAEYRQRFGQ